MIRSTWGFDAAQAAAYARALAEGNAKELGRLLRHSRRFVKTARAEFVGLARVMRSGAAPVAALPPPQAEDPSGRTAG
jgi:hypothetical protein